MAFLAAIGAEALLSRRASEGISPGGVGLGYEIRRGPLSPHFGTLSTVRKELYPWLHLWAAHADEPAR